jgi:hypothetical protein
MGGGTTQGAGAEGRPRLPAGRIATILLRAFNGERLLAEQLDSLQRQSFTNWKLIASDDGSSDRTRSILQAFKNSQQPGRVEIIDGPQRGATANFLFLACREGARELLVFGGADVIVPSHDCWLFQVISACGGHVHYDAVAPVRYRQHGQNVIGATTGVNACMRRLHMLWYGHLRNWSDLNVAALARMRAHDDGESHIFDLFSKARHGPPLRRAAMFAQAGVYRQPCPATSVSPSRWRSGRLSARNARGQRGLPSAF